jgi:hypothetical protein
MCGRVSETKRSHGVSPVEKIKINISQDFFLQLIASCMIKFLLKDHAKGG